LKLDESLVWHGAFTLASGVRGANDLINSRTPLPDAIFCLNDAMAIGMLGELQRAGISVPGDVALAGYDNVDAAEHLSLTSIACPMRLLGQVAARWAVDLLTKNERPTSHRLQVRLVVRRSSLGKHSVDAMPRGAVDGAAGIFHRIAAQNGRNGRNGRNGAAATAD
jgi:DNA-binding LacI/PurR family transcriptional regulator